MLFLRFIAADLKVKFSFSPYSIFVIIVLLLAAQSCSTTNHAPIHKQAYHDITSRYNAYYNASEKWKATIKNIETNHKDDYREVIPVFPYTNAKETSAFGSDADDIVKRSTGAIQLHPYSNWSDDHFLLIGKSYYLKGDYEKAAQTFRYISTKYKDGVDYIAIQKDRGKKYSDAVKKKKKKKDPNKPTLKVTKNKDGTKSTEVIDNRPKRKLMIHDPARSEAIVWLVKSLTAAKQFSDAEAVVAFAQSDNKFYQDYDKELLLAEADLYVKQGRYNSAIAPLEKVVGLLKKKPRARTRPTFVLAQCYEATGNYSGAARAYKNVLKGRPNYDMEFYAKIKRANLGRRSGSGSGEIKSLLVKMSRDGKNKEYLDQIYYELGEISYSESDKISARKYFRKSVQASTTNKEQLAQTYLRLAEIDFEEEQYAAAKYNYDSCLQVMSKDDKRYTTIDFKDKMLSRLVENLNIIHVEDSLQKIANMSEGEREKFVKKVISDRQDAEFKKQDEKEKASNVNPLNNNTNPNQSSNTSSTGSTWYFYNSTSRAQGYTEFIKKWGDRKYEENWRRKDKTSTTTTEETADSAGEKKDSTANAKNAAITKNGKPLSEEDQVLQGVPLTADAMQKSNENLILAYYNLAIIYKDDLNNYRKSLRTFEELNSRFNKHRFLLEDYYYCYLLCKDYLNNQTKAEDYKAKILAEFPNSKIAAVLRDANFLAQETERENAINNYYASAYKDYVLGALDSASEKVLYSNVRFNPNTLQPKFDLLKVLILAKQNRLDDYVQGLHKLIATTKDTEIKKTAEGLLEALNNSGLPMIDLSKNPPPADSTTKAATINSTANSITKVISNAPATNGTLPQDTLGKNTIVTSNANSKQPTAATSTTDTSDAKANKTETKPAATERPKIDTVISNFTYHADAPHLVMVFFKDATITQTQIYGVVNAITLFNIQNYSAERLTAKSVLLDANTKLVSVRQFKNKDTSMEYVKAFEAHQAELLKDIDPSKYYIASISFENFSKLLTEKKSDVYEQFYLWKYNP